jgi:hypothetical protein
MLLAILYFIVAYLFNMFLFNATIDNVGKVETIDNYLLHGMSFFWPIGILLFLFAGIMVKHQSIIRQRVSAVLKQKTVDPTYRFTVKEAKFLNKARNNTFIKDEIFLDTKTLNEIEEILSQDALEKIILKSDTK